MNDNINEQDNELREAEQLNGLITLFFLFGGFVAFALFLWGFATLIEYIKNN